MHLQYYYKIAVIWLLIAVFLLGVAVLGLYFWYSPHNGTTSFFRFGKLDSVPNFSAHPCLIKSDHSVSAEYIEVENYQAELFGDSSNSKYLITMKCPPEMIVLQLSDHDISITSVANARVQNLRNASIQLINDSTFYGHQVDKSRPVSVWFQEYLKRTNPNADFRNMTYENIDIAGKKYIKIYNYPRVNVYGDAVGLNPDWIHKNIADYIPIDYPEIIISDNDVLTDDEIMVILANLDIQILD